MIQRLTLKGLFRILSKTRQHHFVWKQPAKPQPAKPSWASLFSLHDVVIVVNHLLVIEVKKSGKAGNEGAAVINAPLVAGQVYDYLIIMHHMGMQLLLATCLPRIKL
jgi:hypothetical protein